MRMYDAATNAAGRSTPLAGKRPTVRPVVLPRGLAELYAPRPGLERVDPTDAAINAGRRGRTDGPAARPGHLAGAS